MTMVYPVTHEPVGMVLTGAEYDALPPNNLRELVDGVVRIMATPTRRHQDVGDALKAALRRLGSPQYRTTGPLEIRLAEELRRNPDVVVTRAEHYRALDSRVPPEQVVLAVEIVSPGSETDDRREKPTQYAEAGVEHYWRVELEPEITIHTFRRGDFGYVETGVWKAPDTVNAPGLPWARVAVVELDL